MLLLRSLLFSGEAGKKVFGYFLVARSTFYLKISQQTNPIGLALVETNKFPNQYTDNIIVPCNSQFFT